MKNFLKTLIKPLLWMGAFLLAIIGYSIFKRSKRIPTPPHSDGEIDAVDNEINDVKDEIEKVDEKINAVEDKIEDMEGSPVIVKKVTDVDEARNILLDED